MEEKEYILGMDIGGTNLRMGLVDRQYRVRDVEVIPTKSVYESGSTPEAIAGVIRDYCGRTMDSKMPLMIAAGFPSVVDRARRRLYSSTNLPGLDGIDIVEVLEAALGIPVIIQHDAYYLLAYDMYDYKIPSQGTMLGFYFGTGIGNAIFMNGEPYIGKNGTASEVGHIVYPMRDEVCSCGNSGCIEIFSCGKSLERIMERHFPETPIREAFVKHGDSRILDDLVRYMAVPIVAEVNILDPEAVFIGGGLVQMEAFPRDKLIQYVLENTRKPYPAENLVTHFSRPGAGNGIIGAAIEGYRTLEGKK
ncbi:allose kinase [Breznakiella homolactica]|uniref:Allose kinase n=1 Tax=Breznakiella homolactica TaxID=2798577 RepID=A0A7T7XQE5_9SPIR|nr:allose kinase [Breznakiella homolactica]QQO10591.1 allose kinase [Breznakiella homolactica]